MKTLLFTLLLALSPVEGLALQDKETPAGHSLHGEAFNEGPRQRAYLIPGMGDVAFAVATKSPEAQKYFTQGVAQLHSFYYFEAERSFRQAAALDPDLAMAYWGMAKANVNNEKRAKEFVEKASKLKAGASAREQLWITALAEYYKNSSGEKRSRAYVKALENIVAEHPEETEARAFLAWAIWYHRDKGLPINSHQGVDSILGEVLARNPMHPGAHHYRIHLWDEEKAKRGLGSAEKFGPSAPGIAHAWHMPGHIYTKLHRYDDAARHQEASARVDHAQMIRDHTMPYQIHNYAHNNQWLMQDLAYVGRVRDAIAIGENLIEIPRHPKLNRIEDGSSCAREGRSRLFETLVRWEMWDELIARADTFLAPMDVQEDRIKRLRAMGAAHFAKDERAKGAMCIAELQELLAKETGKEPAAEEKPAAAENKEPEKKEEKKEPKKDASKGKDRKKPIQNALAELRGRAEEGADALAHFEKCEDLKKEILARAQLGAGQKEKAEKTAKQAADGAKGQALQLAHYVEILFELGKEAEAAAAWKELAPVVRYADPDLPLLKRLEPRVASIQVDAPAGKRAVDDLPGLGPLTWKPSPAPIWSLNDAEGKACGLEGGVAQPVLMIFYLGSRCTHCVEQLGKFSSLNDEFKKANISIVAISTESSEEMARQAAKTGKAYPFPLLADPGLRVFKEYRCFDDFENLPLHGTFLVEGAGPNQARIRWQDISFTPFMEAKFLLEESKRLLHLR